jgi:hypothetical protein
MSPLVIAAAAWLAVNVLFVLLAVHWAAARRRAFRARSENMIEAAERHANTAARTANPFRAATRRTPTQA